MWGGSWKNWGRRKNMIKIHYMKNFFNKKEELGLGIERSGKRWQRRKKKSCTAASRRKRNREVRLSQPEMLPLSAFSGSRDTAAAEVRS